MQQSLIIAVLFLLIVGARAGSVGVPYSVEACNRSCPAYGPIRNPFGFSPECGIQLQCKHDGAYLGGFRLKRVSDDTIVLWIPTRCDRELLPSLKQLFSNNYAPLRTNKLLLQSCSNSSSESGTCVDVPEDPISGRQYCSASSRSHCYTSTYNETDFEGNGHSMDLESVTQMGCRRWVTSFTLEIEERLDGTHYVSAGNSLTLGWWLEGACNCHSKATCHNISPSPNRTPRYRCYCKNLPLEEDGYGGCAEEVSHILRDRLIALTVATLAVLATLGLVCCLCCHYCKRNNNAGTSQPPVSRHCPHFSLAEVEAATNNFADRIGGGGFGDVYKGTLPNGQAVAVKRLSETASQGDAEFENEVKVMATLNHKNVVQLLGHTCQGSEKLLIYEYVPNGNLNTYIFDPINSLQLNWNARKNIIMGIAKGLVYLHENTRETIIHRDVKPANILIGADFEAKIADFGLAKSVAKADVREEQTTEHAAGTCGYMPPEYVFEGNFSSLDVYSFGVSLLEIISGQKNNPQTGPKLIKHAWKEFKQNTSISITAAHLLGDSSSSATEIERCIHIALLCVQDDATRRPDIENVLKMLQGIPESLPMPGPPPRTLLVLGSTPATSSTGVSHGGSTSATEVYHRGSIAATLTMLDAMSTPSTSAAGSNSATSATEACKYENKEEIVIL